MRRLPDALFIVDTRKEHIAVHEAERLDLPVVALVDTNADPEEVTYPIPANDDAIRAVRLLSAKIADAAREGAEEYASTVAKEEAEEGFEEEAFAGQIFEPEGYVAAIDEDEFEEAKPVEPVTSTEPAIEVEDVVPQVEAEAEPTEAALPEPAGVGDPLAESGGPSDVVAGTDSTAGEPAAAPGTAGAGATRPTRGRTRGKGPEPASDVEAMREESAAEGLDRADAESELVATAADAVAGEVPPAASEAGLGVHPDAEE
jgi:hypothetical protein